MFTICNGARALCVFPASFFFWRKYFVQRNIIKIWPSGLLFLARFLEKEELETYTESEVPELDLPMRLKTCTIIEALLEALVEKKRRESRRSRIFGVFRKRHMPLDKPPEREGDFLAGCLHKFGYLASRPKNVPIPEECVVCTRLADCMLKTVRWRRTRACKG